MFRCFVIFFFFFFFFFFQSSHSHKLIANFFFSSLSNNSSISIHRQVSISIVSRSHWHTAIVSHLCSTSAAAAAAVRRAAVRVLRPGCVQHCCRAPLRTPWRWAVRSVAHVVSESHRSRQRRRPAPSCSCSSVRSARCRTAASPTASCRNRRPCSALRSERQLAVLGAGRSGRPPAPPTAAPAPPLLLLLSGGDATRRLSRPGERIGDACTPPYAAGPGLPHWRHGARRRRRRGDCGGRRDALDRDVGACSGPCARRPSPVWWAAAAGGWRARRHCRRASASAARRWRRYGSRPRSPAKAC
jgi:hypothetical protein